MITTFVNAQKIIFEMGLVASVRALFFWVIGKIIKIKMDSISAITPPSLFGIDRKIA